MNEAKEEAKRKAQSIDSQKAKLGGISGGGSTMSSMASAFNDDGPRATYEPDVVCLCIFACVRACVLLPLARAHCVVDARAFTQVRTEAPKPRAPPKGKGMQLGSKSKNNNDALKALELEDELMAAAPARGGGGGGAAPPSPQAKAAAGESVALVVEEKMLVRMSKDGNLEAMEVRGELRMCVNSAESAFTRVQVRPHL